MPVNGLVVMPPTSISAAGGSSSAAIKADGSVEFELATSLSLNGVFRSQYYDFMITLRCKFSASGSVALRFRAAGSDNSSSSSYAVQKISGGSVVTSSRTSDNVLSLGVSGDSTYTSALTLYVFGPNLVQATTFRGNFISFSSGLVGSEHTAGSHNVSASYDGITFFPAAGTMTGNVSVAAFNR